MDAVRITDQEIVSLKRIDVSKHPREESIIRYFSTPPLDMDPSNHCIPVYDVLHPPDDHDTILLVMPYLVRVDDVKFATLGEIIEFLRQLFEVGRLRDHSFILYDAIKVLPLGAKLHALSSSRTLVRTSCTHITVFSTHPSDVHMLNVMMDPHELFRPLPHPVDHNRSYDFKGKTKRFIRTGHPTRYYYIDFGLSHHFAQQHTPRVHVMFGGDKSVPEYRDPLTPKDPYKIDVYCLGNLIYEDLMEVSPSLSGKENQQDPDIF